LFSFLNEDAELHLWVAFNKLVNRLAFGGHSL